MRGGQRSDWRGGNRGGIDKFSVKNTPISRPLYMLQAIGLLQSTLKAWKAQAKFHITTDICRFWTSPLLKVKFSIINLLVKK